MKHILLGIVGIAACSQHNVTTNTTKAGPTQVFLIDAPFPYDQVARVDVYIVRVGRDRQIPSAVREPRKLCRKNGLPAQSGHNVIVEAFGFAKFKRFIVAGPSSNGRTPDFGHGPS